MIATLPRASDSDRMLVWLLVNETSSCTAWTSLVSTSATITPFYGALGFARAAF